MVYGMCYRILLLLLLLVVVLRRWAAVHRSLPVHTTQMLGTPELLEAVITLRRRRQQTMLVPCTAIMHRCISSTT